MRVEYKQNFSEFPGQYLNNLKPGLYMIGDDDDIILVGKGNIAINLNTLYCYRDNDWFGRVRCLKTGNQVVLTSE